MNSLKCADRGSSVGTETSSTSTFTVNGASSDRSGVPIDSRLHKNFYNMFTSDHESLDCTILYNDSFFDPIVVDVGSFEDGSNSGRNDLDDSVPISRRGRSMSTNEDKKRHIATQGKDVVL
jgi:trimethylamine:corrinoid methyltransferase-like protein